MIGREGPMATPLRPGNVVEVINVQSLPLFLYSISELYDSWQAGWQLASWVAVGKLWQLAICIPLASCVAVGKLYTAGELYIAGELCGRWQAVWQFGVWAVFGGRGVCWPECQNRPPQGATFGLQETD
jgi:hypothetical protein